MDCSIDWSITMIQKVIIRHGSILIILLLALVLKSTALLAADPPDDNFYVGGPDGFSDSQSLSETWHVIEDELPGVPLPTKHPYKDHDQGTNSNGEALVMMGKKFTVRRHGNQWFLIPDTVFGWTPTAIPLKDHPEFVPFGLAGQWRWLNKPVVMIDGHKHDICIGYPELNTSRRDDDKFVISVVDRADSPEEVPFCGDVGVVHPGHSGVGR